jgi:hypothetical protein
MTNSSEQRLFRRTLDPGTFNEFEKGGMNHDNPLQFRFGHYRHQITMKEKAHESGQYTFSR